MSLHCFRKKCTNRKHLSSTIISSWLKSNPPSGPIHTNVLITSPGNIISSKSFILPNWFKTKSPSKLNTSDQKLTSKCLCKLNISSNVMNSSKMNPLSWLYWSILIREFLKIKSWIRKLFHCLKQYNGLNQSFMDLRNFMHKTFTCKTSTLKRYFWRTASVK